MLLGLMMASSHGTSQPVPGGGGPRDRVATGVESTLRLCAVASFRYEKHTILHHAAYHHRVGVSSMWVYIDDRLNGELALLRTSLTLARLRAWPHTRVLLWSEAGVSHQDEAISHCLRASERASDVGWLATFDMDEYLHLGPPLGPGAAKAARGAQWRPWNVRTVLAKVPAHLDAMIMPRLPVYDTRRADGKPTHPRPPVEKLGETFFEPSVYTAARLAPVMRGAHTLSMCRGKVLARLGRGLTMNPHFVFRDGRPYGAALTSLRFHPKCANVNLTARSPRGVRPARADELLDYSALHLFHFTSRSLEECQAKTRDSAAGIAAAIRTDENRSAHRASGRLPCNLPEKQVVHVHGLSTAARATNAHVELLDRRAREQAAARADEPIRQPEVQVSGPLWSAWASLLGWVHAVRSCGIMALVTAAASGCSRSL